MGVVTFGEQEIWGWCREGNEKDGRQQVQGSGKVSPGRKSSVRVWGYRWNEGPGMSRPFTAVAIKPDWHKVVTRTQ